MKARISTLIYFLVLIIFVIFLILFAKNNAVPVSMDLFFTTLISQLWIIVLFAFFIGVLLTLVVSLFFIVKLKMRLAKLDTKEKELTNTLFERKEDESNEEEL